MTRVDSPVPLMHHDRDRSWITNPNPDHPKGTHLSYFIITRRFLSQWSTSLLVYTVYCHVSPFANKVD